jgi:hypothetical protein
MMSKALGCGEPVAQAGGQRLPNLHKLYHVPVFALRELLRKRVPGRGFGELRQAELVAAADKLAAVTEADVEDLYENYRYGRRLSFYLYLLPSDLAQPVIDDLQRVLDELAVEDRPGLDDEVAASEDYESETFPNQVMLLDEETLDSIREIRYRYHAIHRFLNHEEQPDQVLQTRYGFLWLDLDLGYLAILSRDERVNRLLTLALSNCLQAIPVPVRLPKELVDKHFSIEKVTRVSHYDPDTGVRQSLSGHGLWKAFEQEILARERRYIRPSSLYEEEVALGVMSGLGVTSSKGKIYLTKTLPTSVVRTWGTQRLPDLVRDVKDLRADRPDFFNRSLEAINRMRLSGEGRAAILDIVEALLQTEREGVSSVDLHHTAWEIYNALSGRYFSPYLRTECSRCQETAELCPHCEGQALDLSKPHRPGSDTPQITCKECGAWISDGDYLTLRCLNGHITTALLVDGFSIAPNHWFQKRMARIFAEMSQSWSDQADYFHVEGSTLFRLQKGQVETSQLPEVVQNYISNFWEPVSGQIHAGRGDIVTGARGQAPAPTREEPRPAGDGRAAPAGQPPARRPGGAPFGSYDDLDLRLRGSAAAGYTVEAAASDGGSVPPQPFTLPREEALRLGPAPGYPDSAAIQGVGQALFNALFPTRVRRLWARVAARGGGPEGAPAVGLRLRLRIDPPELAALPWELLYEDEFVGLRLRFPIVRYLDLPDPPQALAVRPPLRILVAVSQPQDQDPFAVKVELSNIRRALSALQGQVEVEVMDHATRGGLLARLRQGYHVLHYIGHGTFEDNEGFLVLEDGEGRSDFASATLLGQIVADSSLRFVMLNACETSVAGRGNPYGGVAQQLVRAGMPSVVAMQLAIPDRSAVAFSREFYGALASGWPVDAAVQEGRRGIMTELGTDWNRHVDWAIPTLYMRAPDGVILRIVEEEDDEGMNQKEEPTDTRSPSTTTQTIQVHGPVYGPVHAGSGDIQIGSLQYGMDAQDVGELFRMLRHDVAAQAPPGAKDAALEKIDALQQAVQEDEPDVGMMESVLSWFKKNIPQLAGTVTSVILNPMVGKIVEAAGELVAQEFRRRFGRLG